MHPDDKSDLGRIYAGARVLFLEGRYDRALERFQSIYEVDCTFRDVAEFINDYYDNKEGEWLAKWGARFRQQHGMA